MNKSSSFFVSLAALVLSVAALTMCFICGSKKDENKAVEEALMAKPEMVIEAIKKYEQNMREAAAAKVQELVDANISELNNDAETPFVGPENAKVTVVEFFDYNCGYCRGLFGGLKTVMEANPDVKFVFKPLSFLSDVSVAAAKAVLAANKQGKFMQMHNAFFTVNERLTKEKIRSIAEEQGLDMAKFDADVASSEIEQLVGKMSGLANKIQVNGVPVLFINGKMLQTLDGNEIQSAINSNK